MKLKRLSTLALSLALVSSLAVVPAHAAFTDVSQNDWYYDDVTAMSQLGYAKGYEDGSFKPNGKMTAAETLLFCTPPFRRRSPPTMPRRWRNCFPTA